MSLFSSCIWNEQGDLQSKSPYRPEIRTGKSSVFGYFLHCVTHNQIFPCFQTIFSKFQCGFQTGFNAQHCLLVTIEKLCKTLNHGGETGAVLTDLTIKFNAYGFEKQSIKFIYSYVTKRKKRKILTLRSVHGKSCFQVCLKVPFQDNFYYIYICVYIFMLS